MIHSTAPDQTAQRDQQKVNDGHHFHRGFSHHLGNHIMKLKVGYNLSISK